MNYPSRMRLCDKGAGPHIDADAFGTLRCMIISGALLALVIVPKPRLTFASSGTAGLSTRWGIIAA